MGYTPILYVGYEHFSKFGCTPKVWKWMVEILANMLGTCWALNSHLAILEGSEVILRGRLLIFDEIWETLRLALVFGMTFKFENWIWNRHIEPILQPRLRKRPRGWADVRNVFQHVWDKNVLVFPQLSYCWLYIKSYYIPIKYHKIS